MRRHTNEVDGAGPIREGEELNVPALEAWLQRAIPHVAGPLTVRQFPAGFSNLTYLLRMGETQMVLRRPPFGNVVKTAHDMGREFRVLSALSRVYEPAPKPLAYCDDPTVIGAEFYVMERRMGVVLRAGPPPTPLVEHPELARTLSERFIDHLAELHQLDVAAAGLQDLGRPNGYVERQVRGWTDRYRQAQTDDVSDLDEVATWLEANRPGDAPPSLIHNDYKYDNLLLDPADLSRIEAVLDWEMATVGDSLMDLGTSLAYWVEARDAPPVRTNAFGPTMMPGSLTRSELVARYAERTGRSVTHVVFYYCFGLFKLAGIVQQIYARYVRGHTSDERFARLNRLVRLLGRMAVMAVEDDSIDPRPRDSHAQ